MINLGIGEPKNRTPIPAILSAASMLSTGDVKYTPTDGLPSLKKAIIGYTEEHYGRAARPENVIVTAGAKQAIHTLLFSPAEPAGRSHPDGALLGQLPGDRPHGGRRPGDRHARGREPSCRACRTSGRLSAAAPRPSS